MYLTFIQLVLYKWMTISKNPVLKVLLNTVVQSKCTKKVRQSETYFMNLWNPDVTLDSRRLLQTKISQFITSSHNLHRIL